MSRAIPSVSWLVCWPCREYFKSSKGYASHICPYGEIERRRSPHRHPDEKYREIINQKRKEYYSKYNSDASDGDEVESAGSENGSPNLKCSDDTVRDETSSQNSNPTPTPTFENNKSAPPDNGSCHDERLQTEATAEKIIGKSNELRGEGSPSELNPKPAPLRSRLEKSIFSHFKTQPQHRPPPAGKSPKKSALQPSQVLMNYKTGTEERPFGCELCDKRFGLQHHLNRHRRIHTGEKPFSCDLCSKSYARKEDMKVHRYRVHKAGDVPFNCRNCGEKFGSKLQYELHRQDHNGKKPYECQECGKIFVKKYSFDKHQLLHSGRKVSSTVCHKQGSHSNSREKKSDCALKPAKRELDSDS